MNIKSAFKLVLYTVSLSIFSNLCLANENTVGIGTNVQSGFTIYVPINTGNYLIEPSFYISSKKNVYQSNTQTNQIREAISLELGVFKKSRVSEKIILNFGARFGVYQGKRVRNDTTGISISPLLGVEYYVVPKISIGFETGFRYVIEDIKDTNDSSTFNNDADSTIIRIVSNFIVRYHF